MIDEINGMKKYAMIRSHNLPGNLEEAHPR